MGRRSLPCGTILLLVLFGTTGCAVSVSAAEVADRGFVEVEFIDPSGITSRTLPNGDVRVSTPGDCDGVLKWRITGGPELVVTKFGKLVATVQDAQSGSRQVRDALASC